MKPVAVYAGAPDERGDWMPALQAALDRVDAPVTLLADVSEAAPSDVSYLIYQGDGPVSDFSPYLNLKAVLSLWAGVEGIVGETTLPETVPLIRMVEHGLTWGMTDYITGNVMRYHLGLDDHIARSQAAEWTPTAPPLSRDRKVGVLGLGALGRDAVEKLATLRFDVAGWSRTPKEIEGVTCYSGAEGLKDILRRSEILALLLPFTPETENLLNAERLALCPPGARIINAGRGGLVDDDALISALASGAIGHATLDVFRQEPLPPDHPYWRNPNVTVTPHIASITRPETAADAVAAQIARIEKNLAPENVVKRGLGY